MSPSVIFTPWLQRCALLYLSLCALLSGCGPRTEQLFDKLMGHNSQTALIKDALGDAELSGTIQTSSGQTFELSCNGGWAWRKYGLLTGDEELSVCLSRGCNGKLPIGTGISAVTVRASSPVQVLGIYWASTDAFDKK